MLRTQCTLTQKDIITRTQKQKSFFFPFTTTPLISNMYKGPIFVRDLHAQQSNLLAFICAFISSQSSYFFDMFWTCGIPCCHIEPMSSSFAVIQASEGGVGMQHLPVLFCLVLSRELFWLEIVGVNAGKNEGGTYWQIRCWSLVFCAGFQTKK